MISTCCVDVIGQGFPDMSKRQVCFPKSYSPLIRRDFSSYSQRISVCLDFGPNRLEKTACDFLPPRLLRRMAGAIGSAVFAARAESALSAGTIDAKRLASSTAASGRIKNHRRAGHARVASGLLE